MGGIGKGHLIREIDALDGLIGRMTDLGGIQFRVLNASRGPAVCVMRHSQLLVHGPRAQVDRDLYKKFMQAEVSHYPNLTIIEDGAHVASLCVPNA